jgi:hypothetical protein
VVVVLGILESDGRDRVHLSAKEAKKINLLLALSLQLQTIVRGQHTVDFDAQLIEKFILTFGM